jgi:glutaredoxin-related protein
MNQSKVVLFMKGSPDVPRCGFSRKICGLLRDKNIEFSHFDILTDESVRQGKIVSKYTVIAWTNDFLPKVSRK